jgi:hypothetical protein
MSSLTPGSMRRVLMGALAALFLVPLGVPSAQAEDAYRYWSYWWGAPEGTWEYAASGPADRIVTDGDVEGWVFMVSAEAVPTQQPDAPADFASICSDGAPVAGQVRVGVVLDYGSSDAVPAGDEIPSGDNPVQQCVIVPAGSTGEQALAAAADVRSEQGAVCGIAGYPATGCFEVVPASATTTDASQTETQDAPTGQIAFAVAALVGLTTVLVLFFARKRKPPAA